MDIFSKPKEKLITINDNDVLFIEPNMNAIFKIGEGISEVSVGIYTLKMFMLFAHEPKTRKSLFEGQTAEELAQALPYSDYLQIKKAVDDFNSFEDEKKS